MAERLVTPPSNGVPARRPPTAGPERKEKLTRTLESKLLQGYRIESESDDRAVLSTRGRRRWFGLAHGPEARFEISIDEQGQPSSRRL
jgi:hypothetical protein